MDALNKKKAFSITSRYCFGRILFLSITWILSRYQIKNILFRSINGKKLVVSKQILFCKYFVESQ